MITAFFCRRSFVACLDPEQDRQGKAKFAYRFEKGGLYTQPLPPLEEDTQWGVFVEVEGELASFPHTLSSQEKLGGAGWRIHPASKVPTGRRVVEACRTLSFQPDLPGGKDLSWSLAAERLKETRTGIRGMFRIFTPRPQREDYEGSFSEALGRVREDIARYKNCRQLVSPRHLRREQINFLTGIYVGCIMSRSGAGDSMLFPHPLELITEGFTDVTAVNPRRRYIVVYRFTGKTGYDNVIGFAVSPQNHDEILGISGFSSYVEWKDRLLRDDSRDPILDWTLNCRVQVDERDY